MTGVWLTYDSGSPLAMAAWMSLQTARHCQGDSAACHHLQATFLLDEMQEENPRNWILTFSMAASTVGGGMPMVNLHMKAVEKTSNRSGCATLEEKQDLHLDAIAPGGGDNTAYILRVKEVNGNSIACT
jgi:hypothetical protein